MTVSEQINKAFNTSASNSGLVHLNTKQANTFIDYIKEQSVILKNARVKKMSSPIEKISKIGLGDEIFHPATKGQSLENNKRLQVSGDNITLTTKEIMAEVKILDDELEDNIEGPAFKEHLMKMISKKWANQLEKTALYSKVAQEGDSINSLFDGFVKNISKDGNVIDAKDFADSFVSKEKLTKAYKSIPTEFRSGINKIYMTNDLAIDYETLYETGVNSVARQSAFGVDFDIAPLMSSEKAILKDSGFSCDLTVNAVKWENKITVSKTTGISVWSVLVLDFEGNREQVVTISEIDSTNKILTLEENLKFNLDITKDNEKKALEATKDGAEVIITEDKNLIWGVQRDITIETERNARERATYFVITMRCDFAVENPKAASIIKNVKIK